MAQKVILILFILLLRAQCVPQGESWEKLFAYAQCLTGKDPAAALLAWQQVYPQITDSVWKSVAHNQMGICYLKKEDTLSALRQFMMALRYNPDYPIARHNYEKLKSHLAMPLPQEIYQHSTYSFSEKDPVRDYPIPNPPPVNLRYWQNLQVR
ncbi:MAG: hypothetical protein ACUVRD_09050 [Bacteroidia bacterium]